MSRWVAEAKEQAAGSIVIKMAIEFYGANRWRSLLAPGAEMLGHVRLTRIAGGETLGTSAAFDLQDNAEVFWERGTVQVGMAATFDRRTGRWSVED